MKGQEFIIKFNGDNGYLIDGIPLKLGIQIDVPEIARKFKLPAFWKVKVLGYKDKRLFCKVTSYHSGEIKFPESQVSLAAELQGIEKVAFQSIDTYAMLNTVTQKSSANSFIPGKEFIREPAIRTTHYKQSQRVFKETFEIPFDDLKFRKGHVSFERKMRYLDFSIEFNVFNSFIKEEFEHIKNYFANILKIKKATIDVEVKFDSDKMVSVSAVSDQLSKINEETINEVKIKYVRTLLAEGFTSIVDIEGLFKIQLGDKTTKNPFYNNDMEFIEDIIKISNTKHSEHLKFLSSQHLFNDFKIQFILNPFSFLFLLNGKSNRYLIWETLNTEEATYIWKINKNDSLVTEIENIKQIILRIKITNKSAYLSHHDDNFIRVYHDYLDENGFKKWKDEMGSIFEN